MNTAKYTGEQLASVAQKMLEMPEQAVDEKHSKQEAVRLLSNEIATLQDKGYTIESIAQIMSSHGVQITPATLKNYMRRARLGAGNETPGRAPRGTRRKHASSASKRSEVRATAIPRTAVASDEKASQSSKATFTPKPDSDEI